MKEHEETKWPQRPLSTSTSLPDLPLELRLQIWNHALPNSTYIEFCTSYNANTNSSSYTLFRCSNHAIPPLLHLNREARSVALKHFHLLGTGSSRVYFNPALDTLMLDRLFRPPYTPSMCHYSEKFLGANVRLVQHIARYAIGHCDGCPRTELASPFSSLQSATILEFMEWENVFRSVDPRGQSKGFVKLRKGLRYAFRAEDLVRVDEEALRRCRDSRVWMWDKMRRLWLRDGERPLEVMVMKLPLADWRMEEVRAKMERMKEEEAAAGWFSLWRILGGLFPGGGS